MGTINKFGRRADNLEESRASMIVTAVCICSTLSTLSFVGRIWGRWLSTVKLGWDDLLIAISLNCPVDEWFGCWAIAADNLVALNYGFGYHAERVSDENIRNYIITLFVFFLLQTATTTLIKMAILILYLRTFTTKSFRRAVFILGGLIIANSVAILFGVSFYCVPIAHFWNPSIPGKCINGVVFMTMASGTLLLTDFMIYFLPIPTIWRLNMATRRKMSTTLAFVIGGFVCLTRIIQLVDTVRLDIDDETWSNVDVAMWNIVESHIGCVAANIPLMGPLFTRMRAIFKSPSYPYFSRYKNGASESSSTKNVPSQFGSKSRFSFRPRIAHANKDSSMDGLTENGITVTTDLEQTSHNTSPAP